MGSISAPRTQKTSQGVSSVCDSLPQSPDIKVSMVSIVSLLRNQIALILIERMTDMSATINAHFAIKREYFASYNDARILWYLCS